MATKIHQFWQVFFKCTLIWQLPQYNLTKFFQINLKTTKYYYNHHMEKIKHTFWPTQYETQYVSASVIEPWLTEKEREFLRQRGYLPPPHQFQGSMTISRFWEEVTTFQAAPVSNAPAHPLERIHSPYCHGMEACRIGAQTIIPAWQSSQGGRDRMT